jgi:hypothetical protein
MSMTRLYTRLGWHHVLLQGLQGTLTQTVQIDSLRFRRIKAQQAGGSNRHGNDRNHHSKFHAGSLVGSCFDQEPDCPCRHEMCGNWWSRDR